MRICNDVGGPTKYVDDKDGKQTAAYLCNSAKAGITGNFPATQKFIVVKRDEDGSFAGVGPVLQRGYNALGVNTGGLNFIDLTQCSTGANPTCHYIKPDFTNGAAVIPDAGVTDVETNIWRGRGQFPFAGAPTSGPSTIKSKFAAQGFGVAVTEKLYDALQTAQGLSGCSGNYAAGACQPSISKAQYTSIVAQAGSTHTDWSPILGTIGIGKPVNLCRRVSTSGTQASSDVAFLSNPCSNANPTFGALAVATKDDSFPGEFHVFENSSTGNVKNCLNYRNNGFDNTTTGSFTTTAGEVISNNESTEGTFAIGWVSLENVPAAGTGPIVTGPASAVAPGDKWKFVKLSGVSPNLDLKQRQTSIDMNYNDVFEFEALWRNDIGGARIGFMNAFVTKLSNPNLVDLTGIYVVSNGSTFTNALFPSHVGKGTRSGNSCSPLR